jgi:hypothetical protein
VSRRKRPRHSLSQQACLLHASTKPSLSPYVERETHSCASRAVSRTRASHGAARRLRTVSTTWYQRRRRWRRGAFKRMRILRTLSRSRRRRATRCGARARLADTGLWEHVSASLKPWITGALDHWGYDALGSPTPRIPQRTRRPPRHWRSTTPTAARAPRAPPRVGCGTRRAQRGAQRAKAGAERARGECTGALVHCDMC